MKQSAIGSWVKGVGNPQQVAFSVRFYLEDTRGHCVRQAESNRLADRRSTHYLQQATARSSAFCVDHFCLSSLGNPPRCTFDYAGLKYVFFRIQVLSVQLSTVHFSVMLSGSQSTARLPSCCILNHSLRSRWEGAALLGD